MPSKLWRVVLAFDARCNCPLRQETRGNAAANAQAAARFDISLRGALTALAPRERRGRRARGLAFPFRRYVRGKPSRSEESVPVLQGAAGTEAPIGCAAGEGLLAAGEHGNVQSGWSDLVLHLEGVACLCKRHVEIEAARYVPPRVALPQKREGTSLQTFIKFPRRRPQFSCQVLVINTSGRHQKRTRMSAGNQRPNTRR